MHVYHAVVLVSHVLSATLCTGQAGAQDEFGVEVGKGCCFL